MPRENWRGSIAPEPTVALELLDAPPSRQRCRMALVAASPTTSTGSLHDHLRSRLRVATLIVLAPFVFFLIKYAADGPDDSSPLKPVLFRSQSALIVLLSAMSGLLWSRRPLSMRALRVVELISFGAICVFFGLLQVNVFCTNRLCHVVNEGTLANYHIKQLAIANTAVEWFFLIVIYGVFIPNTWRRCLLVTAGVALLPLVLTTVSALSMGLFDHEVLSALTDMAILVGTAVAVAVFGSYRIHTLHEQAQEARQLGQYRLKQRLGGGGMGEVFLAEHLLLRRPCAVKLIHPNHSGDPATLERFEREVRSMATLTHWNTVEVFDYGRAEDGTFYYVMEFLPGQNLDALVVKHGPLPAARAVHFLRQTCRALREAHGVGLLHRDIKPSNIIACERGGVYDVAKLLDFGLVQESNLTKSADRLTIQGTILGSPPYMSPEQASGKALDPRSDVYSLGAVAYFLLTGRPPFVRDTAMQLLMAHAYDPVEPLTSVNPSVPEDVQEVVLRCLEKDPELRYKDTGDLEKAFATCQDADCWTEERAEAWWKGQPSEAAVLQPTA